MLLLIVGFGMTLQLSCRAVVGAPLLLMALMTPRGFILYTGKCVFMERVPMIQGVAGFRAADFMCAIVTFYSKPKPLATALPDFRFRLPCPLLWYHLEWHWECSFCTSPCAGTNCLHVLLQSSSFTINDNVLLFGYHCSGRWHQVRFIDVFSYTFSWDKISQGRNGTLK